MKKNLTLRHRLIVAMPYSLLHFLIEWKILYKYCNYVVEETSSIYFIRDVEHKVFEKNPMLYFTRAFPWMDTSEGYNFWYRKAEWYKEYFINLKHYQNEQSRK